MRVSFLRLLWQIITDLVSEARQIYILIAEGSKSKLLISRSVLNSQRENHLPVCLGVLGRSQLSPGSLHMVLSVCLSQHSPFSHKQSSHWL